MFQVNATLAIIMSFIITFIDELGEMGEISLKKMILICLALIVGFLIYRSTDKSQGEIVDIDINSKLDENNLALIKEKFKNYSYIRN
jgi:hypothetical protein